MGSPIGLFVNIVTAAIDIVGGGGSDGGGKGDSRNGGGDGAGGDEVFSETKSIVSFIVTMG